MIKQRTLKNMIRATGVGLHTGEKVYLTLRPAAANTGIVFRRIDLAAAGRDQGRSLRGRRHAALVLPGEGRRARLHRRAPDVGALRARHRQRLRRSDRARSADHGRQRRSFRVPAAVGRHRGAERAEEIHPHPADGGSARRRQVGALRAAQRLQARRSRIEFDHPVFDKTAPVGVRGFLDHLLRQGSEPRAHVRLHAGRGNDARAGARARAAASTTRS